MIHPSKLEIGKISKSILDKINNALVENTNVNQWKNSANTIKSFKSIPNKKASSFINFDVEKFYSSISEKLLIDANSYAKSLIDITEEEYLIIMHSRKKLLSRNSEPWVDFDVPMECYDGVEICELVGSFILNQLGPVIGKNDIGLYQDDGLGIFYRISKPMIERKEKLIVKTFKKCGLAITIQCNLKSVNFLDIKFDLQNNVYKPYRKASEKPTYINKNSNHPPGILKQLTKSIEKIYLKKTVNKIY